MFFPVANKPRFPLPPVMWDGPLCGSLRSRPGHFVYFATLQFFQVSLLHLFSGTPSLPAFHPPATELTPLDFLFLKESVPIIPFSLSPLFCEHLKVFQPVDLMCSYRNPARPRLLFFFSMLDSSPPVAASSF